MRLMRRYTTFSVHFTEAEEIYFLQNERVVLDKINSMPDVHGTVNGTGMLLIELKNPEFNPGIPKETISLIKGILSGKTIKGEEKE